MNHLQHYLTKLAEESAEVAQIALKTQQFGPGEAMPGQPLDNFERCHLELDDLWAMVEELNDKFGFGYTPNRERMEDKKAKVRKYLGFSVRLGMVEGERACASTRPARRGEIAGDGSGEALPPLPDSAYPTDAVRIVYGETRYARADIKALSGDED